MTTIINNPAMAEDNGVSVFISLGFLLIIGLLLYYFGIPELRRLSPSQISTPLTIQLNRGN